MKTELQTIKKGDKLKVISPFIKQYTEQAIAKDIKPAFCKCDIVLVDIGVRNTKIPPYVGSYCPECGVVSLGLEKDDIMWFGSLGFEIIN